MTHKNRPIILTGHGSSKAMQTIAPIINRGIFTRGIYEANVAQNNVHKIITRENPTHMPKLKGRAFLKPKCPPFVMDIILFGPGVAAVETAYNRKLNH